MDVQALRIRLRALGYKLLKKDTEQAEALLENARRHVLTYTHLREVPEPLEHIVVGLAAGAFLKAKKVAGTLTEGQAEGAFDFSPALQQIKQGDRSTTFQSLSKYNASTPEAAFDNMVDELADIATYKQELDEFRILPGRRVHRRRKLWRTI